MKLKVILLALISSNTISSVSKAKAQSFKFKPIFIPLEHQYLFMVRCSFVALRSLKL